MKRVLALAFLLACKKPEAVADAAIAIEAAAPPSSSATIEQARPTTTNLLVTTTAEVTVSSRVDNPRDFPEHLVDGKPETAWNGKTGDLSAWIEVKLDPKVHVSAIAITCGFDKGDLFEKNLRITKLKIERDGALVKEATLDPQLRKPQRIPIDGPGGTYRLTVVETLAGTNKQWKEIVVSDLQVLGEAPESVRLVTARVPNVKVAPGSVAPPKRAENVWDVKLEGRRGASVDAICATWKQEVLAVIRKWPGVYEHVECKAIAPPPIEGTRPAPWKSIAAIERAYFDGVADMTDRDLVIERDDGFVGGPRYQTRNDIGDSPSPIHSAIKITPGRLVTATVAMMRPWPKSLPDGGWEDAKGATIEHEGKSCAVSGADLKCDDAFTLYARRVLRTDAELEALEKSKAITFPTLDARGKIVPLSD